MRAGCSSSSCPVGCRWCAADGDTGSEAGGSDAGDREIGQHAVAQLPWGHITVLLEKLTDRDNREWYAAHAVTNGCTRSTLENHIKTHEHQCFGAASTNLDHLLEPTASDLAQQMTKDPYIFDFLAVEPGYAEREIEQALVDRIVDTFGEHGRGFSFVGRQVPFDVDGDEFFVDLLFFHIEQLRYVVVELKMGKFKPEYVGQLGFYVEVVENHLRRAAHAPTVGLLLCTDKNDRVVRYALASSTHPIAIASYDLLSPEDQAALPSEADLDRAISQR
ncbi:putative nuclease of restriction endonuclease-like (RecB) superfamily [Rathayibacter sp. PhB151]|nr:PDDEXK nuclease domain-containing protein [Rathayibacter sp. PhB151]TDX81581.1 putative nuclease of restriction endonuclease-like (RecB) superfamily [Rathayibacter sp. PhB151]